MKPFNLILFTSLFVFTAQSQNELSFSNHFNNYNKTFKSDKSFFNDDLVFYSEEKETFQDIITPQDAIQSEKELISKTLQAYIDGSSYNDTDLIESAFTTNATLYLTVRDKFQRLTPKEYSQFFKNRETGKFNGRVGSILSIDFEEDIAIAKVQIAIPKRNMKYLDLFLLKKTEVGWRIISKTATLRSN